MLIFILFVKDWKDSVGCEPFYKVGPITFGMLLLQGNNILYNNRSN